MPESVSLNARSGAIALTVFAPLHFLVSLQGAAVAPLACATWLAVSFGVLCLCDELGPARPLNRAGLVLYAAAFSARLLMVVTGDPVSQARAELLFAFATMGSLLFWSAALMHRPRKPRAAGMLGAAMTGSTLALILAAHLLAGSASIWGFSELFDSLSSPSASAVHAMTTINGILCLWALISAGLMWTGALRST